MPSGKPVFSFDAHNGSLMIFKNKVRISRSGCLAFFTQGAKGDKDIPIKSITAIQLKEPGYSTNGYIQFNLSGGDTSTGGVFDATKDENTVMLRGSSQYSQAKEAKSIIEKFIHEYVEDSNSSSQSMSDTEKIEKYYELYESGAITESEYKEKKEDILDG
jgi:hypothetical protein